MKRRVFRLELPFITNDAALIAQRIVLEKTGYVGDVVEEMEETTDGELAVYHEAGVFPCQCGECDLKRADGQTMQGLITHTVEVCA